MAAEVRAVSCPSMLPSPEEARSLRHVRHANRIEVEVVELGFREEQQVLPRTREAVLHARGHVVGFVPHDVVPKNPSVFDHRNHESPGNQAE